MNSNNINSTNDQQVPTNVQRKKCHGNRRDQRFRRKCRVKGMKPKIIEKLLMKRKQVENQNHNNTKHTNMQKIQSNKQTTDINNSSKPTTINPNKRKRDVSSQDLKLNSTLVRSTNTSQPLSKKIKEKNKTTTNSSMQNDNNTNKRKYRRPMYLKRLLPRFFKRISKILNYSLKDKVTRDFLIARLELLDEQYCLTVDQQLWQSYVNIGIEHQIWPNQLYNMAKTTDFELCQQYVIKYIKDIEHEHNLCQMKLREQSQLCSITTLPLDRIDSHMKKIVQNERHYLSLRNNEQLSKFKDDLHEQQLFETISQYRLTFDQNEYLNQLMSIRNEQGKIWEEYLVLHMRILYNQLKQYQAEFNQKINSFQGYTLKLQQLIETYIQQNLSSYRMEIEHKIELIHYDYHIQALKLEYYQQKPNEYQKQLMKQLCCSKYEQEITKQEFDLLQQQINYYNSPCQSFECSSLSQSELINSIRDSNIRQELLNQYKKIAVQSRLDIFNLYMKSAKSQMDECKKKFDADMKKLWHDQHSSSDNEKLSPLMFNLIEQRCNKIGDRIRCIYIFKVKSICVKHN
ncbi:unnamed protein product [Rotaria sordida]|uniref:Uncharacterized protein n=1 Tax=Rotaria sordida TaxID=392033 RepID=A0A815LWK6_9BILA|nr:unnamed protein product [Rotaria sordida]